MPRPFTLDVVVFWRTELFKMLVRLESKDLLIQKMEEQIRVHQKRTVQDMNEKDAKIRLLSRYGVSSMQRVCVHYHVRRYGYGYGDLLRSCSLPSCVLSYTQIDRK